MVYVVLPALIPDIREIYDVYFAAFRNDLMGRLMLNVLFPGISVEAEEFRKSHTEGAVAYLHKSTVQYSFKCVDTATGTIVGVALGDIYFKERTEEERKFEGVLWLHGKERERAEQVVRPLWEARERLFGGHPHIYAHVAAVDPEHQGRKAGTALVQWGIDLCERTALPLYLESSPTTLELYAKMGFEKLRETVVHDAELLGTDSDITVPLMVRMPSAGKGLSFYEWQEKGCPRFT